MEQKKLETGSTICKPHSNKGLLSKVYKEPSSLSSEKKEKKKSNKPTKKWAKGMNRHFTKDSK